MKLLLDTCTFLWIISDDSALSDEARSAFSDPTNEIYLSAISVWEIVIKHALKRLPLPEAPDRFIPSQRTRHAIQPLPLEEEAVLQLSRLPEYHKDPFDRMLVAQSLVEDLALVSNERLFDRYGVERFW